MTLSRDELAARFAVVAYGAPDVGEITQDDLAKHAVTMADALLAALSPPVAVAPATYVPKVGDVVRFSPLPHDYIVTRLSPSLGGKFNDDGWRDWYGGDAPYGCAYLRPATAAERAAAGLPVEAGNSTVAPDAGFAGLPEKHQSTSAPVEAVAPPAGKYEPRVGDFVTWGSCTAMWRVLRVDSGGVYAVFAEKRNYTSEPRYLDPSECETLRLATPSELAAAGLAVPPPAPTPAPEAKRPTHVRVTKIGDVGFDVAEGSVYEVVRWYDDGGGAVSPQVMADNGELVELAYVDHSDADYCPSWEPAPCPPPVAGSAEKDEAFKALLAYAECEEAAWGCGELEPTLVLHGKKRNEHAHEFLKRLRTKALALSRPVRP